MNQFRIRPDKIQEVHRSVLQWYRRHRRELQWRTTRDPYEILVSEIMLQQTQVDRVKRKLPVFLEKFPTFAHLARATRADVVRAWKGMGYNNRAVRLRDLAAVIRKSHNGKIPETLDELRQLPGIGPYTSHALLCFAFRKCVPVVDVNIHRVLSRVFLRMNHVAKFSDRREIWKLAEQVLPGNAYDWNQALMDLGATICKGRSPMCDRCPVSTCCTSRTFLQRQKHHTVRRAARPEPRYDGIPHRIWRGKIVEALRNINGQRTLRLDALGSEIKPDFHARELPWLRSLVEALVKDGVVKTAIAKRSGTVVMLAE
ncbi:MAG TPA: A/G-specific adenine glycosylase [Bacteroidota bacterium]|nr:A/G-specific adenine glycosylase [Bacteroidota bacterium]